MRAFESNTSAPMPSVRLQIRSSRMVCGRPFSIETTLSFTDRLPRSIPQWTVRPGPALTGTCLSAAMTHELGGGSPAAAHAAVLNTRAATAIVMGAPGQVISIPVGVGF